MRYLIFFPFFIANDCLRTFLRSDISTVAVNRIFFTVHQTTYGGHIVVICSYMMNQTAFTVYADMCLVSEVPCVSFFRRMCFRITFLFLILCR